MASAQNTQESMSEEKPLSRDWVDQYEVGSGQFDEWKSASEEVSESWNGTVESMARIGLDGMGQRLAQSRRIIRENGITYNSFSEVDDSRLWDMDLVPLILGSSDLRVLEEALSQRMHLLNLLLQDIYGPQKLLRGGKYPPQLVLGSPSFLRPCYNLLPRNRRYLHIYTADVARSPDGSWWVLSDRIDAASGMGYALENRYVSTRVLSDVFRFQNVKRLNPFIRQFCDVMERLAPREKENPLIVLLSPGSYSSTYFEHVFLARTLGYALVEGADLTVRDNRVYLKTTNGMCQVDVIIRRLESEWCDPLELRSDSLLGVPGLLSAIRHGNVAVTNVPGCGVIETPALMAFLPTICRSLLGEELKIPSVATWWCGQPKECTYVLENIEKLVIKPTFRTKEFHHAFFGPGLSKQERAELIDRIKQDPELYTAQEIVTKATTPVFEGKKLEARPFLLRLFMALPQKEYGFLMPGGLGRVAGSIQSHNISVQDGGASKDVWIIGSKETLQEEPLTLSPRGGRMLRRAQDNLPSRVADNLFWLGRYVERADNLVRSILVISRAIQESTNEDEIAALYPFVKGVTPYKLLHYKNIEDADISPIKLVEQTTLKLLWDRASHESLLSVLEQTQRISHTVKERISGNISYVLDDVPIVGEFLTEKVNSQLNENLYNDLLKLLDCLTAFSGTIAENTTRGQDWYFMDIGRRLERTMLLVEVMYACLETETEHEEYLLSHMLNFADSTITYRRRYLNNIWPEAVLDLIVSDTANPRSLAFQVKSIKEHLECLPHFDRDIQHDIDRKALELFSRVLLLDVQKFLEVDDAKKRDAMKPFYDDTSDYISEMSDLIGKQYFSITAKKKK
ncbi:MAG: circularly permuted type 2 ATP-grasp protein [Verrucomicrobiota bacterium]